MKHPEKILLVDDEEGLQTLLKIALNKERYQDVHCASTSKETLQKIKANAYDLILLDVMLPDGSGFDLCREIRQYTYAPIIFLTACSSEFDKLSGLTIGGDDYITKPFNVMELIARIKAIFRRQKLERGAIAPSLAKNSTSYEYGCFSFYPDQGLLKVHGKEVECTAKDLELLEFFCKHPNQIFSVAQLYNSVWNSEVYGSEKTVVIYISRLRKKLQDDQKPNQILVNMRGIGYKFIPPDQEN